MYNFGHPERCHSWRLVMIKSFYLHAPCAPCASGRTGRKPLFLLMGTFIPVYAGLLLGGHTILSSIANSSSRLETALGTFIAGYAGLLLGGHMILFSIANSSPIASGSNIA